MPPAIAIAITGRPNVGKSTLFNRLAGKAMALVDDTPGVTRDWREGEGKLFDLRLRIFDTAGLENRRPKGSLAERTAEFTRKAIERAEIILMLVDGKAGLTEDDKTVAREIRKTGKQVVLLVNKCEGLSLPGGYNEASALGFENMLPISATHGEGMAELYEVLRRLAGKKSSRKNHAVIGEKEIPYAASDAEPAEIKEETGSQDRLHIAVVGRPNAGKSTLINRLIGEDRLLTGPEPGLTRDAIHVGWKYRGKPVRIVDTAGMRRRARIRERLEKMSVRETLRAIRLAHVVILVLDADKPFDKQDYDIARHVAEEGRALVVAVNKWDKVKNKSQTLHTIKAKAEVSLAQLSGVPIVPVSALKNQGLDKLMREVARIYEIWNRRAPTGPLNRWLEKMEANHPPPIVSGRRVKLRYITQIKARPPTFALWVNKPLNLPESYSRFLTGGLRKTFGFEGVPVRLLLRKSENPFGEKKNGR